MAFKLLRSLKEESKRNKLHKTSKDVSKLMDNVDKSKTDERLDNLEKAVAFLLEKVSDKK
jgi:tetrahydromethanopterin S-methyltransferase subunit G